MRHLVWTTDRREIVRLEDNRRYALRIHPAVSHIQILEKLDEIEDFDPEEIRKLHSLRAKGEPPCEAEDMKGIMNLLMMSRK